MMVNSSGEILAHRNGSEYQLRKKNEGIVRICSWNIASIRPLLKKKANFLPEFMRDYGLDVLCL